MKVLDCLKAGVLCLDGGMGTLLQARGLAPGTPPEEWNLTHPDEIRAIHRAYFEAGANVVTANTFGASLLHFSAEKLEEIVAAAIGHVRAAAREAAVDHPTFVALSIGPSGKLLKPLGDLAFEDAVRLFSETARLGVRYGADLILIETMNDSLETKAALLAAKEAGDLPVFVSNAYGEDGKLMTGATPEAMVALLEGMGADAIGANCSFGPEALRPVVERLLHAASVPVLFMPNAGLPRDEGGVCRYDVSAGDFAESVGALVESGVRLAGGCCGTTPEHIRALSRRLKQVRVRPIEPKGETVVSSYTHAVSFDSGPLLIGERINPTGKRRFKEALLAGDLDYILAEGVRQEERGVQILDVNVGLPEIDEKQMLVDAVRGLQGVCSLPLQIDTADASAMEAALRCYNGKALVNSVNGTRESMERVFPLIKKYGGVAVALTLDEDGIPKTAEGRLKIAEKILSTAKTYGIEPKNLVFDPLAMAVSAEQDAAREVLRALTLIRTRLGCHTLLGVSNISFGLPERELVNGTFFAQALSAGLSAAILNPHSDRMLETYFSHRALMGLDENCRDYVEFAALRAGERPARQTAREPESGSLRDLVFRGLASAAESRCAEEIGSREPLALVQEEILPALSSVGEDFEAHRVYLPQLIMSAQAAQAAFEVVRKALPPKAGETSAPIVLATVQGDIHDIGKNIVKLLLENFGFSTLDLGADVSPEAIAEAVEAHRAPILGLSALMTTTVGAMEETIRLVRERTPACRILVGGAVLTEDYARQIGADAYARDAMEGVRYAEKILRPQTGREG